MRQIPLSRLIRVFAWTGFTSLGGGRSAYFHDAVVMRRRWLRHDEFVQDLTLSQVLPGPNFANLAVAIGCRLAGWAGGAGALLAIVAPGAVILFALTVLYFRGGFAPATTHVMHGMAAAVVGLVLVTTARLVRASIRGGAGVAVAAVTFLLVGPLQVFTPLAIALVLPAALWWHRPRGA